MTLLIDSHLHLDFDDFRDDLEDVLARAAAADVKEMITIGCRLESAHRAIALSEKYPHIWATAGVHPHQAAETNEQELAALEQLLTHPRVVGLGETGLDYFYMNSPKEVQQDVFRKHIQMALRCDMPLIIHTRDAEDDTLALLRAESDTHRGVIHCFTGSLAFAEACMAMGFYISISGIATFVKSLQKIIVQLPLERLLVETDSPYLAPVPHRGERNEPAFVRDTASKLAALFGISLAELATHTTLNTQTLFRLPLLDLTPSDL